MNDDGAGEARSTPSNPPLSRGRAIAFGVRLLVLYGLLSALWPSLHGSYARAFRGVGDWAFAEWGASASARFEPNPRVEHRDVKVVLTTERAPGATAVVNMSSQRVGYFPTAFYLALALATLPWGARRLLRAALGLGVVQLFVLARTYLVILLKFRTGFPDAGVEHGPGDTALELVVLWTFDELTSSYLAALLVWALVLFRRQDFTRAVVAPAAGSA